MRIVKGGVVLCALAAVVQSCASGPCRPLREPRSTAFVSKEGAREDACDALDDVALCRAYNQWRSPRCAADDPDCGPQLVRGTETCFRSHAPREAYKPPKGDMQRCSYDGECRYHCSVCSRFGVGEFQCTDDLFQGDPARPYSPMDDPWGGTFPVPTWCGCVAGRCGFFTE